MIWSLLSISLAAERCYPTGVPTEAYCDHLSVPLDWQDPKSDILRLKTIIIPAVRANPEPDPVLIMVGGPGQGAADTISQLLPLLMQVQQHRTLIFMNQRGTGSESPLSCSLSDEDLQHPEEILSELKQCADGLRENGPDPRFFTTNALVKDTEALREKHSFDSMNIYGVSYGSRLALAYMQQHPEHVRSAVLDGVAPANIALGIDQGQNAQRALEMLLLDCKADTECSAVFPNLEEGMQKGLINNQSSGVAACAR